MFQTLLSKVARGHDLSETEIGEFLDSVVGNTLSEVQIGALLAALATKKPSSGELAAVVRFLRRHVIPVKTERSPLLDTCGTGGDASGTFNISTVVAFVAAAAGAAVAKHGNRAASSRSGSADVLEALGVKLDFSPEELGGVIDDTGLGFLYAPAFHPAMKHVGPVRKQLGIKTIFNLAGPLSNPAGASHQLIGVYDASLVGIVAQALADLGSTRAWVVCGHDGLDELTTTDKTEVAELRDGRVQRFVLDSAELGFERAAIGDLQGGDPEENARITLAILDGEKGPKRDIVELNAGAAIYLAELAGDLREGVALARDAIDDGAARAKLDELRRASAA